jgi:hypothetical protein
MIFHNKNKKILHSYKFDAPTLEQHQPQVIPMTPIEAAGQLYKINQINDFLVSSFQVQRKKTKFSYKIILFLVKQS